MPCSKWRRLYPGHKSERERTSGFTFEAVAKGDRPRLSAADCDEMVEALNALSLEYQSQLCATITPDEYIRVNGDRNFYRPIDPRVACSVLSR